MMVNNPTMLNTTVWNVLFDEKSDAKTASELANGELAGAGAGV